MIVLVRAVLLVPMIAGCARSAATTAPASVAAAPLPPRPLRTCGGPAPDGGAATVRDIDWCNRSYRDVGGEHTTTWNRVGDVAYGDLDGDGAEDAAVLLEEDWIGCGDQGSTRITRIRVFSLLDGGVRLLGEDTLNRVDDRRQASVPVLVIDGGAMSRTYAWTDGGNCVDRWRLVDGGLGRVGPPCT